VARYAIVSLTSTPPDSRSGSARVQRPIAVQLPGCGIAVIESHHAPGFQATPLRHDFAKLILVISGRGRLICEKQTFAMKSDALFHIPSNTSHQIEDLSDPISLYAVCYRANATSTSLAQSLFKRGIYYHELSGVALHRSELFRSDIREMLFEQYGKREAWEILMSSRLNDLLVRLVRMTESSKNIVFDRRVPSFERVADYAQRLGSHFFQHQSLDDAARATGLSRRRFTEIFRKVTGKSWLERVHELRLEYAQQLLCKTDKPVISVAFECGFDDLSHFHRIFKQIVGCAPSAFREKNTALGRKKS
jgi:AraC-like DNA-binding protein/quercetin dioxygenase-like cupin family protein